MQRVNWVQRLTDGADLTGETLPGIPVIEIAGDCRVLIERHEGVTEYDRQRICVKVCYGLVHICGCELELTRMSQEQLIVSGQIDCVRLQQRNG